MQPYRALGERSPEHSDPQPDDKERLGTLRSTHLVPRRLVLARVGVGVLLLGILSVTGAVSGGWRGLTLSVPVGILVCAIFVYIATRNRDLRIDLHAGGIVVTRRSGRITTVFEDIDEVWFELVTTWPWFASFAYISGLRLVDHGGKELRVPIEVKDGVEVKDWIIRCCSSPLLAEAHHVLAAGEPLTFGPVRLDARGIAIRAARSEWDTLSLVRLQPGRVAFFRKQKLIPWRTVHLDRVPHPTLFVKLVKERAKHVEDDAAWMGWTE